MVSLCRVSRCGKHSSRGEARFAGLSAILLLVSVMLLARVSAAAADVPVVDLTQGSGESSAAASTGSVNDDPRSLVGMDRDRQSRPPPLPAAATDLAPLRASTDSASETGGTATLFYQLQLLREEVQQLRGLVEEQAHRLDRLAREQKEQYLDIDRRLSSRSAPGSSPVIPSSSFSPPGQNGGLATERDAYTSAFGLTREKRFQEAIDGFNKLIVQYPNGQYTANAFYWLGELYLALPEPELEKSRQSFIQVVNLYPENSKLPDALYKLGVVYDRLGDRQKALEYLDRVSAEFSSSPAARLAKNYRSELSSN